MKKKEGEEDADMNYEVYKECLKDSLQMQLGETVQISFTELVRNNNVKKEAIMLKPEGEPASPVIELGVLYRDYQRTGDLEKSRNTVMSIYRGRDRVPKEKICPRWEQARPFIRPRLVKLEGNADYLEGRPWRSILDMAMVFVMILKEEEEEIAAQVSWAYADMWGIDAEELYRVAMENLKEEEIFITDMASVFPFGLPERPGSSSGLHIMSTKNRVQGARAMLRKDRLGAFAQEKGCNVFILPSSVHEVLLIYDEGNASAGKLGEMVRTINNDPDSMNAEEVLSDSVYYYDRIKNEIRMAEEVDSHGQDKALHCPADADLACTCVPGGTD